MGSTSASVDTGFSYAKAMIFMAALFSALNVLDVIETEYALRHSSDRLYESNTLYYELGTEGFLVVKFTVVLLVVGAVYFTVWWIGIIDIPGSSGVRDFFTMVIKIVSFGLMARTVAWVGLAVINNTLLNLNVPWYP